MGDISRSEVWFISSTILQAKAYADPLLPDNDSVEDLIAAFRRRLQQAVETLRRGSPDKQIILVLDAIDNAAEHARDKGEPCFPTLLLESIQHKGPVDGVKFIVSCRTHRRAISKGGAVCNEQELKPFSKTEAEGYLKARVKKLTSTQIRVAYARSGGNARILEHLALSDRGLLDASEIDKKIDLDVLIRRRIESALGAARNRGYADPEINAFLAGLSVLPPPVPLQEYAEAHGMEISAIQSFAADFAPLLEQTKHGLMFRDEPTETLIRESYAADSVALKRVAENLLMRQGESVYAASALPSLLRKLDDSERLFNLAFDDRFPKAITSTVGQRAIRYARLKAATLHAAAKEDKNRLVHLLVELSTIAAVNQRGEDYILDNPHLVIASQDVDATRRLYEMRTSWQGTRHARLAIAAILSGDLDDASRHATTASNWIFHFYQQDDEHRRTNGGPVALDVASIVLCLIAQKRVKDAARYMGGWRDWFVYEVSVLVFALLRQTPTAILPADALTQILNALTTEIGGLAGALSFLDLSDEQRRSLIKRLATACRKGNKVGFHDHLYNKGGEVLQNAMLKAAVIARSLAMEAEATAIMAVVPQERPRIWSLLENFADENGFTIAISAALKAASEIRDVSERDLLPQEIVPFDREVPVEKIGAEFRKALKEAVERKYKTQPRSDKKETGKKEDELSYETKRDIERFLDERLDNLLKVANALSVCVAEHPSGHGTAFQALVAIWTETRKNAKTYRDTGKFNRFFDLLGRAACMFVLSCRGDLKRPAAETFLAAFVDSEMVGSSVLIDVVKVFAKRVHLHELAGLTAVKARALIERENEVDYRAKLLGELATAILPASAAEATAHFHAGLDQMDAIGSGDYQFIDQLLQFASSLRGAELSEQDFHALTNICELNLTDEPGKFTWAAFSGGLSRTSGLNTLAKLCRWADRSQASLHYTLLPYVTGLIGDDKIQPEHALALLRLADPAELWVSNSEHLAATIEAKNYPQQRVLTAELIRQFIGNNASIPMLSSVRFLAEMAQRVLGPDAEETKYLSEVAARSSKLINEDNSRRNYRDESEQSSRERVEKEKADGRLKLAEVAEKTDPANEASLAAAVDALNGMSYANELKTDLFKAIRGKVAYANRLSYVQTIASMEPLSVYWILAELKACKEEWNTSSAGLNDGFAAIGLSLLRRHADAFISHGQLSGSQLKELSELSGISTSVLALELIRIFGMPDWHVAASIWMNLASVICRETDPGEVKKLSAGC